MNPAEAMAALENARMHLDDALQYLERADEILEAPGTMPSATDSDRVAILRAARDLGHLAAFFQEHLDNINRRALR